MQEKEQKLLQLYDQHQKRAYQVVRRGGAGSTGSVSQQHSVTRTSTIQTSSTSQGGKVRQMFDERRQTSVKGIDRSYPLEPLNTKPERQIAIASNGHVSSKMNGNSTVVRQTVNVKRTTKANINSSINGGGPIISYEEEVYQHDLRNKNNNDGYPDGDDSSTNQTGVHIEEILSDDTIEKNRMLAKIHLMEYDDNLRHRINNDLNNEKFPEDLMVDVPDKLPRNPIAKKVSPAEARLERFKNSQVKRGNATVTVTENRSELRKKSEPMFRSARSTTRGSEMISKPREAVKVNRTAMKPSLRPVPVQDPKTIPHKIFAPSKTKLVKPNCSAPVAPAVQSKALAPAEPMRSAKPELVRTSMPTIKSLEHSPRVRKSPSPEPAGNKSPTSTTKTLIGRSHPPSPTRSADIMTKRTSSTQNQTHPSLTTNRSPRPPSALSTVSSTTGSTRGESSAEGPFRHMATTKAKNPTRSLGATSSSSTRGPTPVGSDPTAPSSDTLVACKSCGRRFAQDRLSLHEKICAMTGQKKRKQFNTALHRVQGTELEAYAKKSAPVGRQAEQRLKTKKAELPTKSNWRRKHEDFINAIRSAKQVQAHLAAGGQLKDLPPPPASDTSDYIQCPHCGRKFNQGAAERHIPKCATMMHNKPNPRALPKPKR